MVFNVNFWIFVWFDAFPFVHQFVIFLLQLECSSIFLLFYSCITLSLKLRVKHTKKYYILTVLWENCGGTDLCTYKWSRPKVAGELAIFQLLVLCEGTQRTQVCTIGTGLQYTVYITYKPNGGHHNTVLYMTYSIIYDMGVIVPLCWQYLEDKIL